MTIIATDNWLRDDKVSPSTILKQIITSFPNIDINEAYHYLVLHGMHPFNNIEEIRDITNHLLEENIWETLKAEFHDLVNDWNGPSHPIYILPADTNALFLQENFQGKSGIAFSDKLFLFLSDRSTILDAKIILTHEYNHVCRMQYQSKPPDDYTLLDSIIMEGIAEYAVMERFGKSHTAFWTKAYTIKQLKDYYKRWILPNLTLRRSDEKHLQILYGHSPLPRMVGYAVGYYLVEKYCHGKNYNSQQLLMKASQTFLPDKEDLVPFTTEP